MKTRKMVRRIFIRLAVCAFPWLIATGQTCLAQTAVQGEIAKASGSVPETSAPPPAPQAGNSISKFTSRFATRERGAPDREDAAAITACSFRANCGRRSGKRAKPQAWTSSGSPTSDRCGATTARKQIPPSCRTMISIPGIGALAQVAASSTGYQSPSPFAPRSDTATSEVCSISPSLVVSKSLALSELCGTEQLHYKGTKGQRIKGVNGRKAVPSFQTLCPFDPLTLCVEKAFFSRAGALSDVWRESI
jgi:hypothetical protein